MEPYYLDSNVFFYAKIRDKKYGGACADILGRVADAKLEATTSTLALLETSNALRKFGWSDQVADEVGAIYSLGLNVHELLNIDIRTATQIFEDAGVSPYDCAHAAVMKRTGTRLILTADERHFGKIRGLTVIDPLAYSRRK